MTPSSTPADRQPGPPGPAGSAGSRRRAGLGPAAAFTWYAVASTLVLFGLLGATTPFVVVLPIGIGIGAFAFLRRTGPPDVAGLVTGVCALPLYIAWTHPGNRFPFLVGGLLVVGFGVGLYRLRNNLLAARTRRRITPSA